MSEITDQFKGLPMKDLIGGPLQAACEAQVLLAKATADFIQNVGLVDVDGVSQARQVAFSFTRPAGQSGEDGAAAYQEEKVNLSVPLLAILNVPSLSVRKVDITFDMEVKSSFSSKESSDKSGSLEANAGLKIGPFHMDVKINGSISSHKENTRSSDNSAKYHVQVLAEDTGMPEGLSRVLDILQSAVGPRSVEAPKPASLPGGAVAAPLEAESRPVADAAA